MKKKDKRKKRSVTLIEMIVVMLLIATIAGALAYNYQGSLTEGKAFKTREGISRIKTILSLALAEDSSLNAQQVASNWESIVKQSPLSGKANDLLKDGWGKSYSVSPVTNENGEEEFSVTSRDLQTYESKKKSSR